MSPRVLPSQIVHFCQKEVSLLLLHPVVVTVASFDFFSLKLEILVQAIQSLLLQVDLSFGASITNLLVLFQFELVQIGVLRYR